MQSWGAAMHTENETPMALWRRAQAIEASINRGEAPDDMAACGELDILEARVLRSPVTKVEDALAVLLAVGLTAVRGPRIGDADADAYERVLDWLQSQ